MTEQDPTKGDTVTDPFPWETTPDPLLEEGRALASERDDLIAQGVDPAELDVPIAPMIVAPDLATSDSVPSSGRILDADRVLDQLAGDPLALSRYTATVRDAVAAVVRGRAEARKAGRPDVVTDQADLRTELVGAADDAEVLERLGAVFVETSKVARGIAGDLVAELPERRGKPVRSVRVGDGQGSELKVTTTPKSETFAEIPEIVEIVGTARIATSTDDSTNVLAAYAEGVREGMAALLEVLAAPKVKTTALDELARRLEGRGEDALAKRLRAQYGRREVGEPTVKIERTPTDEEAQP